MKPDSASAKPVSPLQDFTAIYDRYSREVWATVYARRMDADTAMDLTQEAFLRFWKQLELGESIQNPRAWLLRVARNLAEDQAKSAFRRYGTQPPEFLGALAATENGPLEQMERDELFARIRGVLEELAPTDREILTLRYAFDYETERIAETLGIAPSAVHMRMSRARQRLAEKLTALGLTNQTHDPK